MEVSVAIESVDQPDVKALLRAAHEEMEALIPERVRQEFSVEAVSCSDVKLLVARINGIAVGCCAAVLKPNYSELKKMYVAPSARRQGVANQLLTCFEQVVLEADLKVVKLESATVLTKAHGLYVRHGFSIGSVFGDHKEDLRSLFMEKRL